MTAFRYRALDAAGKEAAGVIEADTGKAARGLLRERGLYPLEVASVAHSAAGNRTVRRKLRDADLTLLTRQWATLLASGLTVEQALAALIEQAETEGTRQLLAGVRSEILAGYSLRAALDRYPQAFSTLYRASVAAGEKSGELAKVMNQLADYLDRSHALRTKTLQALLYPTIVASVALLVIVGLMTYVVPQVVSVFQQGKQALPLLTRALIVVSTLLLCFALLPGVLDRFASVSIRALGINVPVFVAMIFAVGLGIGNAFIIVPSQTLLQERSNEQIRARVLSAFFTTSNAVALIPILFAGVLGDIFGVVHVLTTVAILILAIGLAAESRRWRKGREGVGA